MYKKLGLEDQKFGNLIGRKCITKWILFAKNWGFSIFFLGFSFYIFFLGALLFLLCRRFLDNEFWNRELELIHCKPKLGFKVISETKKRTIMKLKERTPLMELSLLYYPNASFKLACYENFLICPAENFNSNRGQNGDKTKQKLPIDRFKWICCFSSYWIRILLIVIVGHYGILMLLC